MKKKAKEAITDDFVKQRSSRNGIRQYVAREIGKGKKIGHVIDGFIDGLDEKYRWTKDFTRKQAKAVIRESLRTCNPNDRKFNAKKYGRSYREGRLQCIQGMGDGLLRALETHISNLNFAFENTTFRFDKGLTPKEYASMTKDLQTAISLYQSIANTYQPESESPFDVMPMIHNETMLAKIEDNAKSVAQNALQGDTTKALPDSSDTPTDETSESGDVSES
ncbi:MAG: hypothetical protein OXI24_12170 [Candidatus Poribacteria bacterium]|nr:hypothetical protein [Candidatus Poribacteria bacterium]